MFSHRRLPHLPPFRDCFLRECCILGNCALGCLHSELRTKDRKILDLWAKPPPMANHIIRKHRKPMGQKKKLISFHLIKQVVDCAFVSCRPDY